MPVIEAKRHALAVYKTWPSQQNLQAHQAIRSKIQQVPWQSANDFWLHLCSQIQSATDSGNIKRMYDGIKQALCPTQKKTAHLKSVTGKKIQEADGVMGGALELYAGENMFSEEALDAIECLPVLDKLNMDPTLEELNAALDVLAPGKAPGKDGIPAEVLKCCKKVWVPSQQIHHRYDLLTLTVAGKMQGATAAPLCGFHRSY